MAAFWFLFRCSGISYYADEFPLKVDEKNVDLAKLRDQATEKFESSQKAKEKLNISPQELMEKQEEVQRLAMQVRCLYYFVFKYSFTQLFCSIVKLWNFPARLFGV